MKTWAIANQKGGVGKTTTAVSIAGILAARGEPTLVVDLDPHGSMTSYLKMDPEAVSKGSYNLFTGDLVDANSLIHETIVNNLYLIPASTALATIDRQLGAQDGKGLVLKRALQQLVEEFSNVFIDCPPTLGVLMVNALACCDSVVIPVQTEFLAIKGLERMMRTIPMINRARRTQCSSLIVPTMYDRRTRASLTGLGMIRDQYPRQVWSEVIPVDTQFREASRKGLPINLFAPWSRGAKAYSRLLADLPGLLLPNLAVAI